MSDDDLLHDELHRHLQQRAGQVRVTADPGAAIEARAGHLRRARRRTRIAIGAAVTVLVVGGALLVVQNARSHPAQIHVETPSPPTVESSTTINPIASLVPQAGPPLYPEDTRADVVSTTNAFAFCMQNHGVTTYPMVPDNFGDGTVAAPIDPVDPDTPAAEAACQDELHAMQAAVLRANGITNPP